MTQNFALPVVGLFLLAGCDPTQIKLTGTDQRIAENVCTQPGAPNCLFTDPDVRVTGDPVILPRRDFQFFRMSRSLSFVDAEGAIWIAPEQTLTDGASIPKIFVSIIGNPTEPEFRKAAAVHDAYCGVGNEEGAVFHGARWYDVHRMFYEALIVGGTKRPRASTMFAAVYLGGPRWDLLPENDINRIPAPPRQAALRDAVAFIEREDPDFQTLLAFLQRLENVLFFQFPLVRDEQTESSGESSSSYSSHYE